MGGNPGTTLAATATFKLTSVATVSGTLRWGIPLVLANTGMTGALTAMGFGTNPKAALTSLTDVSAEGVVFAGGSGQIPGYSGTELCVYDGTSCSSTNQRSLTAGRSDTMNFVLRTATGVLVLTFSDFAAQIAGVRACCRTFDPGGKINVAPVPLPAGCCWLACWAWRRCGASATPERATELAKGGPVVRPFAFWAVVSCRGDSERGFGKGRAQWVEIVSLFSTFRPDQANFRWKESIIPV